MCRESMNIRYLSMRNASWIILNNNNNKNKNKNDDQDEVNDDQKIPLPKSERRCIKKI